MIEHSLAKHATLVGALSEETALDYLSRRDFDAVIINAASDIEPYVPFVREIRRRSRLYNLPVLMLADRTKLARCENIYKTGITDAIAKPYSCEELKLRVNLLVRVSRFRDSLKEIYQQAKHLATSDSLSGLYSRGFLLEHVSTMVTDANRTSQSFSLASLSIGNIQAINSELGYAAGDRIIRQIGEVMSLLIRGEDLAARYSGSKFIIALPDTREEHARYAIQRINGVIAHTEFVVDGHYAPVMVTLNTTLVGFQQGDTAESLIERTHKVDLKVAA
jgi:two-component system cell cycle response regulator